MNWSDYLVTDQNVLPGKLIVKDTGIEVDQIISLLEQGWSEEKILAHYPALTKESLEAVFAYIEEYLES